MTTLRDSLTASLAPPVTFLVTQFGAPCLLRRVGETDTDLPNGGVVKTSAVQGDDSTIPVVIIAATRNQLQKQFGQKVEATASGLALVSAGLLEGDFLIAQDGVFTGNWFEVLLTKPNDIGGITELALQTVPAQVLTDPVP